MGRYMTVILKDRYKSDLFISSLNEELAKKYGANSERIFNTAAYLQEEVDYMNTDPNGLKQVTHLGRPITIEVLQINCFWLRIGEFSFKLSAPDGIDQAKDAIAVCKWLIQTKCKYIDIKKSDNYDIEIVGEYLNYLFEKKGYHLNDLWQNYQ